MEHLAVVRTDYSLMNTVRSVPVRRYSMNGSVEFISLFAASIALCGERQGPKIFTIFLLKNHFPRGGFRRYS